jgi:hypothetical protein
MRDVMGVFLVRVRVCAMLQDSARFSLLRTTGYDGVTVGLAPFRFVDPGDLMNTRALQRIN